MGLKRRQRVEPEFSLAAMIDVIFLLLMFFMLTSKFVTPNALNLSLPSSSSTSMASPALAVSLQRVDNQCKYYFEIEGKVSEVPMETLQSALSDKISKLKLNQDEKPTITIVAEKSVPINDVVYVLEIANRLKLKTILATDPKSVEATSAQ
ncbi:MAG: ExbD/TolR family protein [Chitinophagales bacterium]|jgi:biopolymer transport protein ExbD